MTPRFKARPKIVFSGADTRYRGSARPLLLYMGDTGAIVDVHGAWWPPVDCVGGDLRTVRRKPGDSETEEGRLSPGPK